MRNQKVISAFVVLLCSSGALGYEWQIEPFDHNTGSPDFCLANVGGQPAIIYYGEPVFIDSSWEYPINYAVRTSEGWEAETVVPAEEKPSTGPLCLVGLPSGAPAICYKTPDTTHHRVWYSTKTVDGWEKEEVYGDLPGSTWKRPGSPGRLRARDDGTPIVGDAQMLAVWYKSDTEWKGVADRAGQARGDLSNFDITRDDRVVAIGVFSINIGGTSAPRMCAMTIGPDWALFKSRASKTDSNRIKAFNDGHIAIAYVLYYDNEQKEKVAFEEDDGFQWNIVSIEDSPEFDNYDLSDLISLPNGEPAIAYNYRDTQQNVYCLKYAWRENGEWLSDTVSSAATGLGLPDLELIDKFPYIAYVQSNKFYFARPIPNLTLAVNAEPNDIGIDTVTPEIGQHSYYPNDVVDLGTERFVKCPDVYRFDHWVGDVNDVNSASTSVIMDVDKAITTVFVATCECGDECHPYPEGDIDKDCRVDFLDIAMVANSWLECTKPECD